MRTLTSTDAVNRKLVVNSNGVSVSLASATIGKGEPKTLIISGVHGDERSGQLLIVNLLKDLPDFMRCHEYPTLKAHRLRDKPFVRIKLMKAVRAGVFERDPSLRLGASVRANDVLGSLIALPDNKAFSIASPYSGIICEMEDALQDAVNAGETLMGIGEPVPDIEKAEFFGGM